MHLHLFLKCFSLSMSLCVVVAVVVGVCLECRAFMFCRQRNVLVSLHLISLDQLELQSGYTVAKTLYSEKCVTASFMIASSSV